MRHSIALSLIRDPLCSLYIWAMTFCPNGRRFFRSTFLLSNISIGLLPLSALCGTRFLVYVAHWMESPHSPFNPADSIAVLAISWSVRFSLSMVACVSLLYGTVSFVRVPLLVPQVRSLLNSLPQSACTKAVFSPVLVSSARIHSCAFSLASPLVRIGIAPQYRE